MIIFLDDVQISTQELKEALDNAECSFRETDDTYNEIVLVDIDCDQDILHFETVTQSIY